MSFKSRYEVRRSVNRKLIVKGIVQLITPARVGVGKKDFSDQPILRDPINGHPMIPGTTWAGLLRQALREHSVLDDHSIELLFGQEKNDRTSLGGQSCLVTYDSIAINNLPIILRDGVSIDQKSGTAEDRKKYDLELIPEGTKFPICFECNVPSEENKARQVIQGLIVCLQVIEEEWVRVGGRTRKGFGCIKLQPEKWRLWDFSLDSKEGLAQWIRFNLAEEDVYPEKISGSAIELASYLDIDIPSLKIATDSMLEIQIRARVDSSLIIRKASLDVDHEQLTVISQDKGEQAIIPGSSLSGVLRNHCWRIADTVASGTGEIVAESLFGTSDSVSQGKTRMAGRVFMDESKIEGGKKLSHSRVKIDRWTGGAMSHHLFTENAWYHGDTLIRWSIKNVTDEDFGLMLLVLKDFWMGELKVGGETSIGRGLILPIEVTINYYTNEEWNTWRWKRAKKDKRILSNHRHTWLSQIEIESKDQQQAYRKLERYVCAFNKWLSDLSARRGLSNDRD